MHAVQCGDLLYYFSKDCFLILDDQKHLWCCQLIQKGDALMLIML